MLTLTYTGYTSLRLSYQPFFSLPSNTTFGLYIGGSTKVGRMSEIRISLGEPPMESWKHKCKIRSELII